MPRLHQAASHSALKDVASQKNCYSALRANDTQYLELKSHRHQIAFCHRQAAYRQRASRTVYNMAPASFDSLPTELQLMIFGFAYAGSEITISQHKSHGPETAIADISPNRLENTMISKSTHATARQAILMSATWSFASVTAANDFLKSATGLAVKRHIRHVRIDSLPTETAELLDILRRAGCAPRTIELTHCTAYDSGAPQPASDALNEMQRNETEVIQHLRTGSCHITDIPLR